MKKEVVRVGGGIRGCIVCLVEKVTRIELHWRRPLERRGVVMKVDQLDGVQTRSGSGSGSTRQIVPNSHDGVRLTSRQEAG
jgi:hypothetical protein